jgi:hypothetical protein
MTHYEFALRLDRVGYLADTEVDALYAATDGDADIEHGPTEVLVSFDRDAPSLAGAIASAVRDVESVAGLHAVGVAQDDGVTLAEIARRTGRTRESIRLYATNKRGPGGFPNPDWIAASGERFWSWGEVAGWLRDRLGLAVETRPHELVTADRLLAARNSLRNEPDASTRAELAGLFAA